MSVHDPTANLFPIGFAMFFVVLLFILKVSLLNLMLASCADNVTLLVWCNGYVIESNDQLKLCESRALLEVNLANISFSIIHKPILHDLY